MRPEEQAMTAIRGGAAMRDLGTLFRDGTAAGLDDRALLDRFESRRDEAAFAAIVLRHGPMVLRTCRATLGDRDEADDAFQATFLVLARRAEALRARDTVGPWLHAVALRVCREARRASSRRRRHERAPAAAILDVDPPRAEALAEQLERAALVHEEVGRLPESQRAAVVLCDLQGCSHEEAANRLGWPVGTVKSRQARARDRLRSRLARRGLAPALGVASALAGPYASARIRPTLADATARSAIAYVSGKALAGAVPASALALATDLTRKTLMIGISRMTAAVVLAVGLGGLGFGMIARAGRDAEAPLEGPRLAASTPTPSVSDDTPDTLDEPETPDSPPFEGEAEIRGRVVDAQGRPVAGVHVADHWGRQSTKTNPDGSLQHDPEAAFHPWGGDTSDVEGRFTLPVEFRGQPLAAFAMDVDRHLGGIAVVNPTAQPEAVEIRLGPTVRLRGEVACADLGKTPYWSNLMLSIDRGESERMSGKPWVDLAIRWSQHDPRIIEYDTHDGTFDFEVPAGTYQLYTYASPLSDYESVKRRLTLDPTSSEVDLGTIDLPATALAKTYGQEPPPWEIAEARGLPDDVTLGDFRGKWVLLDFWGYSCGPCLYESFPKLITFLEEHEEHRDLFQIIAVHDSSTETLAEVDRRTAEARASAWGGAPLPFPILLDRDNATFEAFGISAMPTAVLIDPEGKIAPAPYHDVDQILGSKLPPIPIERKIAHDLDQPIAFTIDDDRPVSTFYNAVIHADYYTRIKARFDPEAMEDLGIEMFKQPLPLRLQGTVSMRSALELILRPFDLIATPHEAGLLITKPGPERPSVFDGDPSAPQLEASERINGKLDEPITFDLRGIPLAEVVNELERLTDEIIVLDPKGRLEGGINADATVDSNAEGEALGRALGRLLEPLGLGFEVVDEVILIVDRPEVSGD